MIEMMMNFVIENVQSTKTHKKQWLELLEVLTYYRELIMLFTSWQKWHEETDLMGNCYSYRQYFFLVKDIIDIQMKQYTICCDDLNQMEEHLNNIEENDDNLDLIDPTIQDIEHQDEAEGAQDLHHDLSEKAMTYQMTLEFLPLALTMNS